MKEFLSHNNVPFEARNVSENQAYMDEIQALGSSSVPVLKVGEEVIIGNNQEQITRLLKNKGLLQ